MRIIIICINIMLDTHPQIKELVIHRKDIDFSKSTVERLTRSLLNQIEIVANALCESPLTLRSAISGGTATIGAYQSETGSHWVYVNLNNHNYVIPYVLNH